MSMTEIAQPAAEGTTQAAQQTAVTKPDPGATNTPQEIPDINTDSVTYFLLTSLTSGQSSIVTATSRLELLLIVHKVPYVAIDVATHEKAKSIWLRRANGKRLPGIVHDGMVLGNFDDLEQWNEYGEFKLKLGIEESPRPASLTRTLSIASISSVSTTTSKKPSAHPLPPSDPIRAPPPVMPTALVRVASEAAALAMEKRKSGAFSIASSSSSIRSVSSIASTVKKPSMTKTLELSPKTEGSAEEVQGVAPEVEEFVAKSATKSEESVLEVEESVTKSITTSEEPIILAGEPVIKSATKSEELVLKVEEPTEEIVAPSVRGAAKTRTTGGMRSRAAVPAAARRGSAVPLAKTIAERAIKASSRASVDEKTPTSRPGSRASIRPESRASSLRPESRVSVRPDSRAAKRTSMSGLQEKKAPSITARSLNSTSSSVKPSDKGKKGGKKEKSRIDKLKKEEVK